jgi:uncharacterized C2H2 Zn-finger protein
MDQEASAFWEYLKKHSEKKFQQRGLLFQVYKEFKVTKVVMWLTRLKPQGTADEFNRILQILMYKRKVITLKKKTIIYQIHPNQQPTQQQNNPNPVPSEAPKQSTQLQPKDVKLYHCDACRTVFTRENDYKNHLQEASHLRKTALKQKYDKKVLEKLEKDKQGEK